jgi:hypothetical protein
MFKKSMRNPTTDVYACMVGFMGKNAPEQPAIANMLLQYVKFLNVTLEDNAKVLAEHLVYNLAIELLSRT